MLYIRDVRLEAGSELRKRASIMGYGKRHGTFFYGEVDGVLEQVDAADLLLLAEKDPKHVYEVIYTISKIPENTDIKINVRRVSREEFKEECKKSPEFVEHTEPVVKVTVH